MPRSSAAEPEGAPSAVSVPSSRPKRALLEKVAAARRGSVATCAAAASATSASAASRGRPSSAPPGSPRVDHRGARGKPADGAFLRVGA